VGGPLFFGASAKNVCRERLSDERKWTLGYRNWVRCLYDPGGDIQDRHQLASRLSLSVKGIRPRVGVKCPLKCWSAGTERSSRPRLTLFVAHLLAFLSATLSRIPLTAPLSSVTQRKQFRPQATLSYSQILRKPQRQRLQLATPPGFSRGSLGDSRSPCRPPLPLRVPNSRATRPIDALALETLNDAFQLRCPGVGGA
jgi:hypothetical protein